MQHWRLIGHMVRSSASTLPCATLTSEIHVGALHQGRRRYRRGPDYTSAGQVSQFLRLLHGVPPAEWRGHPWRRTGCSIAVLTREVACNVEQVPVEHMSFSRRCLQGMLYGS